MLVASKSPSLTRARRNRTPCLKACSDHGRSTVKSICNVIETKAETTYIIVGMISMLPMEVAQLKHCKDIFELKIYTR